LRIGLRARERANKMALTRTIEGPEALFKAAEANIPTVTDIRPMMTLSVNMTAKDRERLRALAAGIISMAVTKITPTSLMDKAMTAVQTPFLNQFSEDLTLQAQFGRLGNCIAREQEITEIFRVVDGGRANVILVGEHGVGKKSVIEGLAQKMVLGDVPQASRAFGVASRVVALPHRISVSSDSARSGSS